jgi:hypothetical protein
MAKVRRGGQSAGFTPFPEPLEQTDVPLVVHNGFQYRCSGCGGDVPDGAWLDEDIADGMVVGLLARHGQDGPVVHACGSRAN